MFAYIKFIMIKTTIKILLAFHLAVLFPCFLQNQAEASTGAEIQEYIIERLNNIRSDPLSYAEGLGYDRQALLETLPFLGEFIEKNVELFTIDEFLNLKAGSLNSPDTLEHNHDVLPENDYANTGETRGTVTFSNFMGIETAVQIIINNLFKKELDPEFKGQRYILFSDFNANFNLAGASLTGGRTWDQTGMKNSYFITICFASSLLKSEVQVLNMINQVRAYPLKINKYIPFSLGSLIDKNVDVVFAFFKTYQPLFIDKTLQKYGTVFNADTDYPGQALSYGYNGVEVERASVTEIFPDTDLNFFAVSIFSSLLLNELITYPEKKIIFNTEFNNAGLALSYYNEGENKDDYANLTITAGNRISENSACSRIYGIIYKDIDENDLYAPGEGAAKETVIIYNKETSEKVETLITDNAGHFSVNLLNQKEYIIQTGTGDIKAEKEIYLDADQFLVLKIMPIESENLNIQTEAE